MATNPYMLGGLAEGFMQGLDIAYRAQDRAMAKKEMEEMGIDRTRRRAAEDTAAQRAGITFDQQQEQYKRGVALQLPVEEEKKQREEARQLDIGSKKAQIRASSASAAKDEEVVSEARRAKAAARAASFYNDAVVKAGDHLASLIEDPEFIGLAEETDALINGRTIPNYVTTQDDVREKVVPRVVSFTNKMLKPELDETIGKPIDLRTAELQGLPKGQKYTIHSSQIFNVRNRGDEVAVELKVTALGEDGKLYPYNSAITEDRSSAPDAEVKWYPISKFAKLAEVGGNIAQAAKELKMQGATTAQIAAEIRARSAEAGVVKKGQAARESYDIQNIKYHAKILFNGDEAAAALFLKNGIRTGDRLAAAKIIIDNTKGKLTLEDALKKADEAIGSYSPPDVQIKKPSAPEKTNSGWSVTEIK